MKRFYVLHIIAFILLLSVISCEHDFELEVPKPEKNVVLANFAPDSVMKVYVSSTVPVGSLESESQKYPNTAEVKLMADGSYMEDLTYRDDGHSTIPYYHSDLKMQTGVLYEIEVEVKGRANSKSSNIIPNDLVELDSEIIDLTEVIDHNYPEITNVTAKVRLSIKDDSQNGFYYHIKGSAFGTPFNDINVINNIDHLSILHEEGTLVRLSDLDTSVKIIDLEVEYFYYPEFESREPFQLEIRKCSKDYYLFHRSVGEQEISNYQDGILSSQSVQIHNNIIGGVGNFSSYNSLPIKVSW